MSLEVIKDLCYQRDKYPREMWASSFLNIAWKAHASQVTITHWIRNTDHLSTSRNETNKMGFIWDFALVGTEKGILDEQQHTNFIYIKWGYESETKHDIPAQCRVG